jgi:hypothetical protein
MKFWRQGAALITPQHKYRIIRFLTGKYVDTVISIKI